MASQPLLELLKDLVEEDVAILTLGVAQWSLFVDLSGLCFLAYFSSLVEFRMFLSVGPQVLHTLSSLLLIASSVTITVRSKSLPHQGLLLTILVGSSLLLQFLGVAITLSVDASLITSVEGVPVAGSDADVDAIVNVLGKVSVGYHVIVFMYTSLTMVYFALCLRNKIVIAW